MPDAPGRLTVITGDAGKSSYDIAVKHGFIGTEEDYLNSLHGATGNSGGFINKGNWLTGTTYNPSDYVFDTATGGVGESVWLVRSTLSFVSTTHPKDDLSNWFEHIPGTPFVPTTRLVSTQYSIQGGGDLSADRTLQLVNDVLTPGINKVYGTDGAGARGWQAAGAGGGTGDVISDVGVSVADELVKFAGTTGKHVTRATGTGLAKLTSGVLSTITDNSSNWDSAFTDRLKWDGGATGLVAATGRTSLGLVIGTNVQAWDTDLDTWATLTPSANFQTLVPHTFAQIRTDLGLVIGTNVQAWDTQLDSLAALSYTGNTLKVVRVNAGETGFELATVAGGSGTVTSIATTSPITGGTITTTGTIALDVSVDHAFTAAQGITLSDAATNTAPNLLTLVHNSSATPAANFGAGILLKAKDSTTNSQDLAGLSSYWVTATHGSTKSNLEFKAVSASALGALMTLKGTGSTGVGILDFPGAGGLTFSGVATIGKIVIGDGTSCKLSASTYPDGQGSTGHVVISSGGNYVESTPTFPNASATTKKVIKSDGTNWVESTETYDAPGTSGNLMQSDGTNWTSVTPKTQVFADAPNSIVAINVLTGAPATLVTKSITYSAGDTVIITAFGQIVNNSGAVATYSIKFNIGSMTATMAFAGTVAASATVRTPVEIQLVVSILSTSSAWLFGRDLAAVGANLGTASGINATNFCRYVNQQSSSNLTGAQTTNVQMFSSTNTATQSFELAAYTIQKFTTNP